MSAPLKQIVDNFLTDDERTSPVWQSVKGHLERMLAKARILNDNPNLTPVQTATLRGQIQTLRAMITLGATPPVMTAPNARPGPRIDLGAKYG